MYVLDAEIMLSVVAFVSPLIAYFHTFGGASMVRTPSEGWVCQKTMEPQKPGNSLGSGPEVVERQKVAKE